MPPVGFPLDASSAAKVGDDEVTTVADHVGTRRDGRTVEMARDCSCGHELKPDSAFCLKCSARRLPAAARAHGASEAAELAADSDAPDAVKFAGYASYVDSAVASLRATLLAEAEKFAQQEAAADANLHALLTQLQVCLYMYSRLRLVGCCSN